MGRAATVIAGDRAGARDIWECHRAGNRGSSLGGPLQAGLSTMGTTDKP
jgi:hypothetical protein